MVLQFCVWVKLDQDFWLVSLSNSRYFGPRYKLEMFGVFSMGSSACELIKHTCSEIFVRPLFSYTKEITYQEA